MANWKRWSTRWGQLAVVVVMMLAAIGAWEIVKGMARLGGYAHADVRSQSTPRCGSYGCFALQRSRRW